MGPTTAVRGFRVLSVAREDVLETIKAPWVASGDVGGSNGVDVE